MTSTFRGTIVFVANRGYALKRSRESLIDLCVRAGWRVILATSDDADSRSLCGGRVNLEPVTFHRGGLSVPDLLAYRRLREIFRTYTPALIQNYHAKPVIFGTRAARAVLGDSARIVNTITGLGRSLPANGPYKGLGGIGYRMAAKCSDITVFQNRDDRQMFIERGWIPEEKALLVVSSGVNLQRFTYCDRSNRDDTRQVVVMIARLLKQKGVPEFVELASRARKKYPNARFLLAGEEEPSHPDAVSPEWIRRHGHVEYLGRVSNVEELLNEADLFVFPSYYREGTPRVIIEAAATGLPTVAFDVPGVREVVASGDSGYLVPERDGQALFESVLKLLKNRDLRREMGGCARRMAEEKFDIDYINSRYAEIYRDLGVDVP